MVSFCARFLARGLHTSINKFKYFSTKISSLKARTDMCEETVYIAFPDKPSYFKRTSLSDVKVTSHTAAYTDARNGSMFLEKSKYNIFLAIPDVDSKHYKYIMSAVTSQSLVRKLTNIVPSGGGCALCTVYRPDVTMTSDEGPDIRRGVCVYFPQTSVKSKDNILISEIGSLFSQNGIHKYSCLHFEDCNTFTKVNKLCSLHTTYEESKYSYSRIPFTVTHPTDSKTYESYLFARGSNLCPVFHGYERTRLVLKQFYEEQEIPEVSELLQIMERCIPESFTVTALKECMKYPFIVVEGLDATGKTTVTQILCEKLNGVRYYTPPEPIEHLRKYFDTLPEIIRRAYYSVGNYIVALHISKKCAEMPVIMDRYWHSTTAYGIANETSSGDLPCHGHWVYKWPLDLLQPDVVLFLSVSEEVRKQRLEQRCTTTIIEKTFEEKSLDKDKLFRQRLYEAYRRMEDPCCIEMDASSPLDTVVKDAMDMLQKHGINCGSEKM